MSARDNGGQAFPRAPHLPGMDLRDYFAAKAMQSLILAVSADQHSTNPGLSVPAGIALDAYALADAMLAERE